MFKNCEVIYPKFDQSYVKFKHTFITFNLLNFNVLSFK